MRGGVDWEVGLSVWTGGRLYMSTVNWRFFGLETLVLSVLVGLCLS